MERKDIVEYAINGMYRQIARMKSNPKNNETIKQMLEQIETLWIEFEMLEKI
jgi:hypothetical protein